MNYENIAQFLKSHVGGDDKLLAWPKDTQFTTFKTMKRESQTYVL